ncbi:putative Fe-S cluster assembly protein SufT [Cerasicoccus arenae]|uniref:Putative Fe-S cluster assembly protein SufT n=1 Tax=Cerasicoccus arenae TaxID=424488 RepID=A0A8J3DIB6_9BACT|nr:putative Fe-S cluster assembly protein SufT [Cerasicoccus arenae]MBK1858960.1 putative Fe-S cluster assembly protein SufT [Cerasicoccus arenae]GHC04103.1 putative Fe-S cluster assembly protein SufT [Cerasicoccus arenae]
MSANNQRTLTRDVEATVIPAGDKINLPIGTKVDITHRLGGNFTVVCDYGMFRILGTDADALGEEKPEAVAKGDSANGETHEGPPGEDAIWDALKSVYDPEIPVNIVDLGLVYSMDIMSEENEHHVAVQMTLTAPGCGMGPAIAEDAKGRVESVPGVKSAQVDIVWDPPWTQDMISEEGKMELGLI